MIESWMVSIVIALAGLVFSYGFFKSQVKNIQDKQEAAEIDAKLFHSDLDKKLNAQFKKTDEALNRCTILESTSINHLTVQQAEDKFVLRSELNLHLKNIESELEHTNKNSDMIVGKLEDLTKAFSDYLVRGLNDEK